MNVKDILLPFEMTEFDAADLGAAFQVISDTGFPEPCVYLRLINNSDADITISFDGVTNHDFVQSENRLEIYTQISSLPQNRVSVFQKGTKIYVSGPQQSKGTIYLCGYYRPKG